MGKIKNVVEILVKDTGKRTIRQDVISLIRCSCGVEYEAPVSRQRSCGCKLGGHKRVNLSGQRKGLLDILESTGRTNNQHSAIWKCFCNGCKKIVEVCAKALNAKSIYSCGCSKYKSVKQKQNAKKGKEHPMWNPNLTVDERAKKRQSSEDKEFSKKVFIRDNYMCTICRIRGGQLNAHHLDGYHWCKEKRDKIENGVTLCQYCHRLFHRIYGNRNNTRFQFLEFKRDYASLLFV